MYLPDFWITSEQGVSAEREIARVMAGNGGDRGHALDLLAHTWADLIAEDAASGAGQWHARVAEWVYIKLQQDCEPRETDPITVVSREPMGIAEWRTAGSTGHACAPGKCTHQTFS